MDFPRIKISKTPKELEFGYYLKMYEDDVQRHSYWKNSGSSAEQTATMRENSSHSAKIHFNSILSKYLLHLKETQQSPKIRAEKLRSIISQVIGTYEKNGLGHKTAGDKGKMLSELLHMAITSGSFTTLIHNPGEKAQDEHDLEFELKDTVAHVFQHKGVASDIVRIFQKEFRALSK